MATQIQRRRGTTAQHSTFTGALGELTVDTDKKTVVVHDGITAGGFPLAVASKYAPLASPALSGTPTAPTAAQFDATTKIATMAALQRALGNYAGQVGIAASRSLLASESGLIVNANGNITVTLPVSAGVIPGVSYQINNAGAGIVTVRADAGDNLYGTGKGTPRTFVLGAGDSITVGYVGGASWYAWGGLQLGASAGFGSSLSNSGYQKLPSGLIIQWGVTNSASAGQAVSATFAIAFPAACLQATMSAGTAGANVYIDGVTFTATTISGRVGGSGASIARYIAIGY